MNYIMINKKVVSIGINFIGKISDNINILINQNGVKNESEVTKDKDDKVNTKSNVT